jgi:hypothetical protein
MSRVQPISISDDMQAAEQLCYISVVRKCSIDTMNTPMIGFRLDPKLTELMDARCLDLNISRAEWLRSLIVSEVGSPVGEGGGDDQIAIAEQLRVMTDRVGELIQAVEDLETWVLRRIDPVAERVTVVEGMLRIRGR